MTQVVADALQSMDFEEDEESVQRQGQLAKKKEDVHMDERGVDGSGTGTGAASTEASHGSESSGGPTPSRIQRKKKRFCRCPEEGQRGGSRLLEAEGQREHTKTHGHGTTSRARRSQTSKGSCHAGLPSVRRGA